MTLQELMALFAAALWGLLWWPVGHAFGWWQGLAAAAAGGFAGLMLGFLYMEWLNSSGVPAGRVRLAAEVTAALLGLLAFVALPLWVLSLVRTA
jgi:hypothetical protein